MQDRRSQGRDTDRGGPWKMVNELHLQVTASCNLRCRYCYAADIRAHEGTRSMPELVARAAIDEVLAQSEAPALTLILHGGEPLLRPMAFFDRVCMHARRQAEAAGRVISFGMQTNLVLLTDAKAAVLARHGVSLGTSIDGPQEIHDSFRGAHEAVMRGAKTAARHGILGGAIVVIQEHNCRRMSEVLGHLLDLGFTSVSCNVGAAVGRGLHAIRVLTADEILEAQCQVFEFMASHNFALVEKRVLGKVDRFLFRRHSRSLDLLSCETPFCHAGVSMVAVDIDGGVYPCGCAGTDRNMVPFRIATIGKTGSYDRARLVAFHAKQEKYTTQCPSCRARFVCEHGCPAFYAHDRRTAAAMCIANQRFHDYLAAGGETLERYKTFFEQRGIA